MSKPYYYNSSCEIINAVKAPITDMDVIKFIRTYNISILRVCMNSSPYGYYLTIQFHEYIKYDRQIFNEFLTKFAYTYFHKDLFGKNASSLSFHVISPAQVKNTYRFLREYYSHCDASSSYYDIVVDDNLNLVSKTEEIFKTK